MDNITEPTEQFERRKGDHIRLALEAQSQSIIGPGFERVEFLHEALPSFSFSEVDISVSSFGGQVKPFFVSSMTAGHRHGKEINKALAEAASKLNWRMGVGSQRRELFDPLAREEWQELRRIGSTCRFLANLGLTQVIHSPIDTIRGVIDSLEAEALIIHLNPLQECLQKEGTPFFRGGEAVLSQLCQQLSIPVIVKETGCGISRETMLRLRNCGVSAIDVAGRGGTHWGRIEGARAEARSLLSEASETFAGWGISTVDSLCQARGLPDSKVEIWASGGIRNGLDAAKCLALGASQVGLARCLLESAMVGADAVIKKMETLEYELRIALFCTGSSTVEGLKESGKWRVIGAE